MNDRYGLPLSTASDDAAKCYQDGMDRLLAYRLGAEASFAASAEADPDFGLAHSGAALHALFQGDGAGARASIAAARQRAGQASRRERQHIEALGAVIDGDGARGLALIEEHLGDFPRDALLVHQASSSIGFSGRADRETRRLEFVERLAPAYGDDWWYDSALSFVYHEVGRYDESRRLSERSLEHYPENANASHNLAHVFFETADMDGGAAYIEDRLAGPDRDSSFHCHLAWHLALFELQRGREARALQIYAADILGSPSARMTIMDGAALLWRLGLGLYGDGAGLPWEPLREVAARAARPGFVFGDIHAALVHAALGDEAAISALADGLRALEARGHPIAGSVVLPLVRAAAAFAAGDAAGALALIEPLDSELHRIGGSHAQWELFEETMVACQLRLGRADEAIRLLRRRLARRASPRDQQWLARAEAARSPSGAARP